MANSDQPPAPRASFNPEWGAAGKALYNVSYTAGKASPLWADLSDLSCKIGVKYLDWIACAGYHDAVVEQSYAPNIPAQPRNSAHTK